MDEEVHKPPSSVLNVPRNCDVSECRRGNVIICLNSPFGCSLIAGTDAIAENNEWKMTCNTVDN